MVSVRELQIHSMLWLERSLKISLPGAGHRWRDQGKVESSRKSENGVVYGIVDAKEQTAKKPDKTHTGMPYVECFWDQNHSPLPKHTTSGQHQDRERETAEQGAGWLDQADLLSKAGLCVSERQAIQAWITKSSITAFILISSMGKWGFGHHHANISKDWLVDLRFRCFPEGHLIICLSWGGGGGEIQQILVSYSPFLLR